MRRLTSLMLAMVMGISWTGSPVCAEEGNPTAPPAVEQLPGKTPAQDQMANGMQQQVLEGMQAQAAAMQPPDVAPPPVPAPAAPIEAPQTSEQVNEVIQTWVEQTWDDTGKFKKYVIKALIKGKVVTIMEWVEAVGGDTNISIDEDGNLQIDIDLPGPIDVVIDITVPNLPPGQDPDKEDITPTIDVNIDWEQIGGAIADAVVMLADLQKMMENYQNNLNAPPMAPAGGTAGAAAPNPSAVAGPAAVGYGIAAAAGFGPMDIMIEIMLQILEEISKPPTDNYPDLQPPVIEEGDLILELHTPDLDKPLDIT